MKKGLKLLSAALLAVTMAGCSCSKEVNVKLSNPVDIITGDNLSSTLTTNDIYVFDKYADDWKNSKK